MKKFLNRLKLIMIAIDEALDYPLENIIGKGVE